MGDLGKKKACHEATKARIFFMIFLCLGGFVVKKFGERARIYF